MKLREDMDSLMSGVTVSEEMHRAILEGRRRKRRFSGSTRALVSAAAVLFVISTMYVGAGYLMEHTPLRDLFVIRPYSANMPIEVPNGMQRQDIYDEILDSRIQDREDGEVSAVISLGEAGEMIIDNEMYSIELLETTCAGREITVSYILTRKAWNDIIVDVWVDTDSMEKILDGSAEEDDFDGSLLGRWFTDRFGRSLAKNSGYTLAMNQEFCVTTQLGNQNYQSGEYRLHAICHTREYKEDGTMYYRKWVDEEGKDFYSVPIEIVGNEKYGLDLSGNIDGTVEDFQLEEYGLYISPLTIYLNLSGERSRGVEGLWSGSYKYELILGFEDGTEVVKEMSERGVQGGNGNRDVTVELKAGFDRAIDPDSIVSIVLNDITIMKK